MVLLASLLASGCGSDSGPATIADLAPAPDAAADDKGPAILDGCRSGTVHTEAWACVYGDPASEKTVVLWGDSHAMQFTPPLIELADRRGWRLLAMFRGSCLTAEVAYRPACDSWRANALDRIERERPEMVVTATDTGNGYALWQRGVRLTRAASEPLLRQGYARTLRRLKRATGGRTGRVVLLRDLLRAGFRPPDCLLDHPEDLPACDFKGFRKNPPGFDLAAARRVGGVKVVDPSEVVCPAGLCNSARNGIVVYRDTTHISATYAATLAGWLGEQVDSLP
ncbi:MAG: hypothetical protein BGO23_09470 [Solirubrobacterales bacterium 67-14]|nr:MAG: hypothetical protein BGO23_09470 [Solirubrobacterales bacterium 67-14]